MLNSDVKKVQTIIEKLDSVANLKARAEGRLESVMASLKALGYNTIEEAEAALAVIEKSIERRKVKLEKDFSEFQDAYGGLFDGLN